MPRQETSTGHDDHQPPHPEETSGDWAVAAYGNVLDTQPIGTTDIAYGTGVRYALGRHEAGPQATLDLFAEHGVVRLTHLAEGVQVTLFHQEAAPTATPDGHGLVFELPTPTRWLSVRKDGSTTLFVEPVANATSSSAPAPHDRILPTADRSVVHADAPLPAPPERKERSARGRIEGHVVYDPEFRISSRQQRELASFVVAEHYTDAQGEQQTVFHRLVAFNGRKRLADQVRDDARTGDHVVAHGAWHDVPITYKNGTHKTERQLWLYGIKITPKDATKPSSAAQSTPQS